MLIALLVLAALIAVALVALCLWLRRQAVWTVPLQHAHRAEAEGDYATAARLLQDALDAASKQSGAFARMAPLAVGPDLARVLYRQGDLERSAALNFELLEAARGVT